MAKFIGKHTIMLDGEPYMARYWIGRLRLHIFYRGDADPDCHDHPWDFWTFPLTSYVEEVLDPDIASRSKWAHDVVNSSITCEPSRAIRPHVVVRAFVPHFRKATHAHRVLGKFAGISVAPNGWAYPGKPRSFFHEAAVCDGKIITIVWRGKFQAHRQWGFIKNRGNLWCWEHWKKYINGGRNAGCE